MNSLTNKRVLLGVTGGIAAYKAAELVRRLQDQGADVRVVMTPAATEFITPLTMQALSGHPVSLNLLDTETESVMGHIELARWADLILIAPASADFIARFCAGQGDDLLTTICLAASSPVAIAPAMNQAMWSNPRTVNNIEVLRVSAVHLFGPEAGLQACGEVGEGRLLDVNAIVDHTINLFPRSLLTGKKVMITAGPTREAIDPVRYISNHSSGKQGYALAVAALEAGAEVILVSGPTGLPGIDRVRRIDVVSAQEMYDAVHAHLPGTDIFIGVAAVADYRPVGVATQKIKKDKQAKQTGLTLELVENPDIIRSVAESDHHPFTVGFAAETENLEAYAKKKLITKKLDMVVANNVADKTIGFNADDNATTLIYHDSTRALPKMSKQNVARHIIEAIAEQLSNIDETNQAKSN